MYETAIKPGSLLICSVLLVTSAYVYQVMLPPCVMWLNLLSFPFITVPLVIMFRVMCTGDDGFYFIWNHGKEKVVLSLMNMVGVFSECWFQQDWNGSVLTFAPLACSMFKLPDHGQTIEGPYQVTVLSEDQKLCNKPTPQDISSGESRLLRSCPGQVRVTWSIGWTNVNGETQVNMASPNKNKMQGKWNRRKTCQMEN